MFSSEENNVLIELIDKEIARIHRDFKNMDSIGDSFYINEGLIFENMHVRKKLDARLVSLKNAKEKLETESV